MQRDQAAAQQRAEGVAQALPRAIAAGATSVEAAGENAAAAAPCPSRAANRAAGLPARRNPPDAAANASSPPISTGLPPTRSARAPNTGLRTTSAPS